jgi:hypothetical protein
MANFLSSLSLRLVIPLGLSLSTLVLKQCFDMVKLRLFMEQKANAIFKDGNNFAVKPYKSTKL